VISAIIGTGVVPAAIEMMDWSVHALEMRFPSREV